MENAADCMYGSVMMKEDKDQYIANFLNTMDQDFLSKFHHKMNCSTSSSSSTDSNEMFEEPKLKNMKLKAVQSEESNMVNINLLRTWNACQRIDSFCAMTQKYAISAMTIKFDNSFCAMRFFL